MQDFSVGDDRAPTRGSQGFTLIEVVITIALMGLVVTAVLASMQVTLKASRIDRENAVAYAWLQAASDEIHRGPRQPCTADGQGRIDAIALYDAAADNAAPPPVWTSGGVLIGSAAIEVIEVEYLGRNNVDDDFEWSTGFCFEGTGFVDSPLYTQRVTIEITEPDGQSRTLEMVKSE